MKTKRLFLACLVLVPALFASVQCTVELQLPGASFFDFGTAENDKNLTKDDDSTSVPICLSENNYFWIFGAIYDCLNVNVNGILSSNGSFTQWLSTAFEKVSQMKVLLAVFWTDLDTRSNSGNGTIYYRSTTNQSLLDEADRRIHQAFESQKDFKSKELVIITWDHVGCFYSNTPGTTCNPGHFKNRVNTFQAVLAVGEEQMFAIYLYSDLMKSTTGNTTRPDRIKALVGYTTADHKHSYTVNSSLTDGIVDIQTTSNVGVPGQWIFRLGSDPPLTKQDNENPTFTFYTKTPQEEVTADSGDVVVGQEEDIGVTVTVEEGTVPKGKNLTLTLKACINATADFPAKEGRKSEQYDPVSSFYVVEKNNVELQKELEVTIVHYAYVENIQEYEDFRFSLWRKKSTSSALELVGMKIGYFDVNENGDTVGIVRLSDAEISVSVFVRIMRKEEVTPTSVLPGQSVTTSSSISTPPVQETPVKPPVSTQHQHKYNVRLYRSRPYSMTITAVFAIARNEPYVRQMMHTKILQKFEMEGLEDNSCKEKDVFFARESNSVMLHVDQSEVIGYCTEHLDPPEIERTQADRDTTDVGFPSHLCLSFHRQTNKGIAGGSCSISATGFTKPVLFPLLLSPYNITYDACSENPCQNGGICHINKDSYTCDCDLYYYQGTNCEKEVGVLKRLLLYGYALMDYFETVDVWSLFLISTTTVLAVAIIAGTFILVKQTSPTTRAEGQASSTLSSVSQREQSNSDSKPPSPKSTSKTDTPAKKAVEELQPRSETISISELVIEVGISESELDQEVSDEYLNKIALVMDDWLVYARQLGLNRQQIKDIESRLGYGLQDRIHATLQIWRSQYLGSSQFRSLLETLLEYGHTELAMNVCKLLKRHSSSATSTSSLTDQSEGHSSHLQASSSPSPNLRTHTQPLRAEGGGMQMSPLSGVISLASHEDGRDIHQETNSQTSSQLSNSRTDAQQHRAESETFQVASPSENMSLEHEIGVTEQEPSPQASPSCSRAHTQQIKTEPIQVEFTSAADLPKLVKPSPGTVDKRGPYPKPKEHRVNQNSPAKNVELNRRRLDSWYQEKGTDSDSSN